MGRDDDKSPVMLRIHCLFTVIKSIPRYGKGISMSEKRFFMARNRLFYDAEQALSLHGKARLALRNRLFRMMIKAWLADCPV